MSEKITVRKCEFVGCDRKHKAKGYCNKHYYRHRTNGNPSVVISKVKHIGCKISGCEKDHKGKGYCQKHYSAYSRHGDPNFESQQRKCDVNNCDNNHSCQGYCKKHYTRMLRHGDPSVVMLPHARNQGMTMRERFESRFVKKSMDTCWEWEGSRNRDGYGGLVVHLGSNKYKTGLAHRYSYELYKGKFDEQLLICHSCDNPSCVNPNHLFLGTCKDNLEDMVRKKRSCRGERNSHAKLTECQVIQIRSSHESTRKLSDAYKVSICTIESVKNKNTWKHLGD